MGTTQPRCSTKDKYSISEGDITREIVKKSSKKLVIVLRDSEGKKLPVKSYCRGIMIAVAVIVLGKWHGAGMPNGDVGKPAIYRGRMSL